MKDSTQGVTKVKLLMLGEASVGKSSILSRFVDDKFNANFTSTLGVEYKQKQIKLPNGKCAHLNIWDTAGQDRFRTITPLYYKSIDGVILVFSLNDAKSLENVDYWLQDLSRNIDRSKIKILLVGNKVDMADKTIEKSQAEQMAEQIGVKYYEASAKKNINIKEIFFDIAEQILKAKSEQTQDMNADLFEQPKQAVVLKNGNVQQNTNNQNDCCK